MVETYTFPGATAVLFGESAAALATWLGGRAHDGASVIVVDPAMAATPGMAQVATVLDRAGLDIVVYDKVTREPDADMVEGAARLIRETNARLAIGLGGGSALDTAKLAAAVAGDSAPVEAYAQARRTLPTKVIPAILIPTTAGTGSEMTRTAIFTDRAGRKTWAWGDALRADAAILDPALTVGLPAGLTAATGIDALVHAIEGATVLGTNPFARACALAAIGLIVKNLPRAVADPADLDARGAMLTAAALAGIAIDTAGTGIAHAIGHALGAAAKVHHGRAVGLAMAAAIGWNAAGAIDAYRPIAAALCNGALADDDIPDALASAYGTLLADVRLNRSLVDDGLTAADLDRLLALTQAPENEPMLKANSRPATADDLRSILLQALTV